MGAERHPPETTHYQARPKPNSPIQCSRGDRKTGNLSGGTSEAAQRDPARRSRKGVQAGMSQGRIAPAHGDAELPECPREEDIPRDAWAPGLLSMICQGAK
jgi:hypothetical protein